MSGKAQALGEKAEKWTPGPWDCWDMDEFGWHVFANKFGSREVGQDCRLSVASVRIGHSSPEQLENYYEQVANARLISAAPTMAEYIRKHAEAGDAEAKQLWEAINGSS